MSDFKTRLEAETVELQVYKDQKSLLTIQSSAMETYLRCLKERLIRL